MNIKNFLGLALSVLACCGCNGDLNNGSSSSSTSSSSSSSSSSSNSSSTSSSSSGLSSTSSSSSSSSTSSSSNSSSGTIATHWVGTWATSEQLVETNNNPPTGLSNNTLRQVFHVSIGGEKIRLRLSNEYSNSALVIKSAHIAKSLGSANIDINSDSTLLFAGKSDITIPAKSAVTTDPISFNVQPGSNLAVTLYFGSVPNDLTGHPGSRTTSYIQSGNDVTSANLASAVKTEHWYVISALDVEAPKTSASVAILGDSITDGRGSGTDKQNRWPDELAKLLRSDSQTKEVGILNHGVGGNCVLKSCLGPAGNVRFDHDVLAQTGVQWAIILEGVNDLGNSSNAATTANELISSFTQMIEKAHDKGILIFGATILPFGGSSYDNPDRETARKKVNNWIRTSAKFDAVIDFDAAMRDPNNQSRLLASVDSGDHLHPNENGYTVMAAAVKLSLFY